MKGRVLIVEDTKELAELYAVYLRREGLECLVAPDAETALPLAREGDWDLVLLDLNLPGMDGFQYLESIRSSDRTPVVIVSAREADEDVIRGLGAGADDFIVKPCPPKVLVARVRAHLRRSGEYSAQDEGRCSFGPFELDAEACYLRKAGSPVTLSSREMGILCALAEARGRPMSPDQIYDRVWGQEFGEVGAVGVYIQRLRRKLEEDPAAPLFIQTVRGMGYRLNPQGFAELRRAT
jgi:DNA-binding response OmpR family regulator